MAVGTRNEEDIKKDLVDQLYWDSRIDAADVHIDISDGSVILTGTVPTVVAKMAAEDDAWITDGVGIVDNQLEVRFPPETALPDDEEITSNVMDTLLWHPSIDSADITPVVENGWVTLRGAVPSYWQKIRAERVCRDLTGVVGIINELAVVPSEDLADQNIAEAVVSSLERNPYVEAEQLDVEVQNGVVTLSGEVPSMIARQAANDSAQRTVGVINVENNLTIADSGKYAKTSSE